MHGACSYLSWATRSVSTAPRIPTPHGATSTRLWATYRGESARWNGKKICSFDAYCAKQLRRAPVPVPVKWSRLMYQLRRNGSAGNRCSAYSFINVLSFFRVLPPRQKKYSTRWSAPTTMVLLTPKIIHGKRKKKINE